VARAWEARLYGFSTLEAMAARWPVAGDIVCPALDARRGEVYGGAYRVGAAAERPALLLPDAVETAESLAERLAKLLDKSLDKFPSDARDARVAQGQPKIWLGGSGARRYRDALATALGDAADWIPAQLGDPAADSLALLGAAALRADDPGVDPLAVAPVYLRPSDAEKRHGIDVTALVAMPGADRP
jgi:tRNA threonylcarbamoyladenosine biosynthesis protein TsaB